MDGSLLDKFGIPSEILDTKNYNAYQREGKNPLSPKRAIICSYNFAAKHMIRSEILLNGLHVEEHQAGVFILVFLRQMNETVLFVERNGRKVCINGNISESGMGSVLLKHVFHQIHQPGTDILTSIIFRDSKPSDFHGRITTRETA